MDVASAVLSILATIPLVYAIKRVLGCGLEWTIVVAAILGVISGILFISRQRTLATPLIDLNLLPIPAFSGGVVAITLTVVA